MSIDDVIKLVTQGGGLAVLGLVLLLLLNGKLITGSTYKDLMQDRDDWKEIALTSASGAEKALDLAERRRRDGTRGGRGA